MSKQSFDEALQAVIQLMSTAFINPANTLVSLP